MSVGLRIRLAREQKQMTLDEVAKRCKTTRQTIYKYENEIVTNIPYDKIELLSEALGVTPSYLFGWEEQKEISPGKFDLTEGEKIVLDLFRKVPAERQDMLIQMIRVALGQQE